MSLGYRKNAAAIVLNKRGEILACERTDRAGVWQFPQGGIDDGESAEEAVYRELVEEIGTDKVTLLATLPRAIRYEWPKKLHKRGYRGQEQHYFLFRLKSSAKIDLKKHHQIEFARTEWVGAAEFVSRLQGFKSEAYKKALSKFQKMLPGVIAP